MQENKDPADPLQSCAVRNQEQARILSCRPHLLYTLSIQLFIDPSIISLSPTILTDFLSLFILQPSSIYPDLLERLSHVQRSPRIFLQKTSSLPSSAEYLTTNFPAYYLPTLPVQPFIDDDNNDDADKKFLSHCNRLISSFHQPCIALHNFCYCTRPRRLAIFCFSSDWLPLSVALRAHPVYDCICAEATLCHLEESSHP